MRTRFIKAWVVATIVMLQASFGWAGTAAPGYVDTQYASGLSAPVAIAFMPDGRLLIAEKDGDLKLKGGGAPVTLASIPVCSGGEMGLLGIALDPSFNSNGFIYLYRTESTGGCGSSSGRSNEVVRVTLAPDDTVSLASLIVLLTGIRTDNTNHNGGGIRLGPDNKLYVGVGDTGNGDNQGCPGSATNPYTQDLNALEGKILRLNLDGTAPADNPYFGQVGKRGEVFASGLRNPFRLNFDPVSGSLWVADVGDLAWEEIDIVTAAGNYGFPHCEGNNHPAACANPGDIDPIFEYGHDGGCPGDNGVSLGSSITGGAFAGAAFGPFANDYIFADYTGNAVYRLAPNPGRTGVTGAAETIVTGAGNPVDLVTGPDGAIYYVAIGSGEVRRLAFTPPAPDQQISGKKLGLKQGTDPARKGISFKSGDDSINIGLGNSTADDPVLNNGSLRVRTTDGCGGPCDNTYALVPGGPDDSWKYLGSLGENRGYRFRSKAGAIRSITIKPGKGLSVSGRGAGLGHNLVSSPDPIDLTLTIGGHRYCMQFGGTTTFTAGKSFRAKEAAAPVSCLP